VLSIVRNCLTFLHLHDCNQLGSQIVNFFTRSRCIPEIYQFTYKNTHNHNHNHCSIKHCSITWVWFLVFKVFGSKYLYSTYLIKIRKLCHEIKPYAISETFHKYYQKLKQHTITMNRSYIYLARTFLYMAWETIILCNFVVKYNLK